MCFPHLPGFLNPAHPSLPKILAVLDYWSPSVLSSGCISSSLFSEQYIGAYDEEESAARAYDFAALKYWGTSTFTNFPESDHEKENEIMKTVTKEEISSLLKKVCSRAFSQLIHKIFGI
ncbi:hypothetical protein OIU76_014009 [Salix suchowensis]|nr:hypothetical protein OIU76_014009 [Salix suchowensis]